jgi:glycosyltransferase involved in cell wall biosynthesis
MFLHRVLIDSCHYTPHIISLAMSSRDEQSVRLLSPASWLRSFQVAEGTWQGLPYRHAGVFLAEVEFQRYQPRRQLTELLNQYDLVQVVAGTPAWGYVARDAQCPVCLFTATIIRKDRATRLRQQRGWRRLWYTMMTDMNARIEQAALQRVSCVFGESIYTCDLLRSIVAQEKLVLGVPGVDTDVFQPDTYCPHGHILAVGRFSDSRKNVRLLFDAYHRLRQNLPDAPRLSLAGHPPVASDQEYAVSLGIADQIDIHGSVTLQQLAELYRGASIFVLPSDEEGLGIVILEAMASGLPVVSTDCGGPATAVVKGETGYLTPVGDATAMAEALQRLIEAPSLRQRMGQAGRKVAEDRFSIAAAGQAYLEQYDALLKRR